MGLTHSPTPNKAGGRTQGRGRDSLDPTVGGSDYPVFTDERAPTEMKASFVLDGWKARSAAPITAAPQSVHSCSQNSPSHLQGHLPGPGARNSVLSIDDPGQTGQHRLDGGDSAAWGDRGGHVADLLGQLRTPQGSCHLSWKPRGSGVPQALSADSSYPPWNGERPGCPYPGMPQGREQKTG